MHDHSAHKVSQHQIVFLCLSAQNLLLNHSGLFFAPLALVVVNDDSARCKKMAAMAIKALLIQLDLNHQNTLFSLVNTWLKAEKVHTLFRATALPENEFTTAFFFVILTFFVIFLSFLCTIQCLR